MFDFTSQLTLVILAVTVIVTLVRIIKGPTLPDRVVAMDLLGVVIVGFIVVLAGWTGVRATLDAAIVIALIGFVATVAYATYVQQGYPE